MSTNPWDVPPPEPTGTPNRIDLFTSVGQALDAWEQLESWLGRLFLILCETQSVAAKDAYGAILAHTTRNEMLQAATKAYFKNRDKTVRDKVIGLIRRVKNFAARRNEIAHGHSVGVTSSGVDKGFYWIPPDYNINKRSEEPFNALTWPPWRHLGKYQYTSPQIDKFCQSFWDLQSEVMELLRTWPKS